MPTVKVTAGTAVVEIEAAEMSAPDMVKLALETLRSAHQIDTEHTKMDTIGFSKE